MSVWKDEFTCKPLKSYSEILLFLQNPPPWRTLCEELRPHSKFLIKNSDLVKNNPKKSNVKTETFCHNIPDPDDEDVERHEEKKLPKTLVCHDMANGYHDDCMIDGTGNHEAYTFYNWAGIDIFCYFSHHLITIPPLGWINVGHAHGVKVIGTVITEWNDGIVFWDKILPSEEQYKKFANALVAIARILKFDGWLLNVENKISKPAALLGFVKYLHQELHRQLHEPVLIWYDSVTTTGHLNWQNALNHNNKPFFDACDGLFTNYSWTEKDVASSARVAGERLSDLYIGLDVWGRNFYGGGKLNLRQAVEVAHSHGCSLAIFAQAWTHEAVTTDQNDLNTVSTTKPLDKYGQFLLRDRALWDSIWRCLNTRVPCQLPFKTSFCRGQGKTRRLYGEVLCPVPWYNLRHMQYQPNSSHGPHGYMLTAVGNRLPIPKQGIAKDANKIIEIKEAGQAKQDSLAVKQTEEINIVPKADTAAVLNEGIEIDNIEPGQSSQNSPSKVKRKMKTVFKHIFESKAARRKDDDIITGSTEESYQVNQNRIDHDESKEVTKPENASKDEPSQEGIVAKESGAPEQELSPEGEDDTDSASTGRSMLQPSININLGQSAKTTYKLIHVPDELPCLEIYFDDAFIGGSCLKVNPSENKSSPKLRLARLLHCDFFYEETLVVGVATKTLPGYEEQFLNLKCYMKDGSGANHTINLIGHSVPAPAHRRGESPPSERNLYPIDKGTHEFRKLQKFLLLKEPETYVSVDNPYNWKVRYYRVKSPRMRVWSVHCRPGRAHGPILAGHLALCAMPFHYED